MNRHGILYVLVTTLLLAHVIRASETPSFKESPRYQSVLRSKYIRISGEGRLGVSYEAARLLFEKDDMLDAVQQAYGELLAEGEQPEFVVKQHGPRHWGYVNKSGHNSEIIELHRRMEPGKPAELVLYTEGERFFGNFRAVINVNVEPVSSEEIRYDVLVYAYPDNAVSRFFARHLGIAERFFRHKTDEITELATRICRHMLSNERATRLPQG